MHAVKGSRTRLLGMKNRDLKHGNGIIIDTDKRHTKGE
jgi:hypothetical protein